MPHPRILIVAGEVSGDARGAGLVRALRAGGLEAEFYGVGGTELAAEGVRLLATCDELAVVGIAEVLGRLPHILGLLRRVRHEIHAHPPDLFIPVDAPDFNLRLLPQARARRVPVVYFVAPQLWAWRARRIATLRRCVDELLVLFPFEESWFRERGVAATYVGHPLVDQVRALAPVREDDALGLLLPGSRRVEIRRHLPILAGAVRCLTPRWPGLRWIVRQAPGIGRELYAPHLEAGRIELDDEPIQRLASRARIVVSASGTASFEAALTGTPLVVVYRTHPLTFRLLRRMVRVPHIAMANLAAGRAIVPELLQEDCTSERVAEEVALLLTDAPRRAQMKRALGELRERFGPPGAYDRAARRVRAHLGEAGIPRAATATAARQPGGGRP